MFGKKTNPMVSVFPVTITPISDPKASVIIYADGTIDGNSALLELALASVKTNAPNDVMSPAVLWLLLRALREDGK